MILAIGGRTNRFFVTVWDGFMLRGCSNVSRIFAVVDWATVSFFVVAVMVNRY